MFKIIVTKKLRQKFIASPYILGEFLFWFSFFKIFILLLEFLNSAFHFGPYHYLIYKI
jgi:hypothetical protein